MAHQVEAERIDAVLLHPQLGRIDHQLRHHRMFGGGVVAAGRAFHFAGRVEPVVIAGHDAIEHRRQLLPGRCGVVIDHVHAHAQPGGMQRLQHRAEFADADGAVLGIGGVAALRHVEVIRVVAPVEAVFAGHCGDRRLLRIAVGRGVRNGRRGAADFRHRRDVEHRQQMHIGHAGVGHRLQMTHAGGILRSEAKILAARCWRHRGIAEREIAHVQFVDRHVRVRRQRRGARGDIPTVGLRGWMIEIEHHAALGIGGERNRIRIGDAVADDADAGGVDVDEVGVGLAVQHAGEIQCPHAGRIVAPCGEYVRARGRCVCERADRNRARGRRP